HVVAGTFGWFSILLPLVLMVIAVRFFRFPQEHSANGRIFFGLLFATISGSSISQLVFENPPLGAALDARLTSGGVVRYLIVDLRATLVPPVPVWILTLLIAFCPVLVITATPVGKIPSRLVGSYHWLPGQDSGARNANRAIDEAESE